MPDPNFYQTKWDKPYLTPSLAKVLLERSPLHAKLKCPFFGPVLDQPSAAMNEGSIVDALVLGGDPGVTVLDVDHYRTAEARKLRDEAVNPIKMADYQRCVDAADAVKKQVAQTSGPAWVNAIDSGAIKRRLFWKSGRSQVECSTEPDVLFGNCVIDLKRTGVAPTIENWRRHASSMSYHIQVAATLEATGAEEFHWLIVEAGFPHAVVIHQASPAFIKVGQRDWRLARDIWNDCVKSDRWPGYESGEIDPAGWLVSDEGDDITFTEESAA